MSNAALAAQVTDALTRWNDQLDQLAVWLTGSPSGGPNGDGRYPLTNASGETQLFQSLPSILDQVTGPAGAAEVAQAAAEAASSLSDQHRAAAEAAKNLAELAKSEVSQLKADVIVQRDDVAAKWSDVSYWHGQVSAHNVTVEAARVETLGYRDETLTARDDTLVARDQAQVARDEAEAFAASIDPATLVTTAQLQAEFDNLIGGAPGTLDTLNEIATALGDDPNFATTVTTQLAGKSDVGHGHVIGDISGLQTALDGKQPVGNYALQSHTHSWSEITGKPSTFTPSAHGHVIADVTGLQAALDAKATRDADVSFRDVHAKRGDGTGAVFLGSGSRYLYWNNSHYVMPGNGTTTDLQLNGRRVLAEIDSKADAGHTHSYLPLSGGTLTGQLIAPTAIFGTGAGRMFFGNSSGRFYMAARNAADNDWLWSNEFGFNTANNRWYTEGSFEVTNGGDLYVKGRNVLSDIDGKLGPSGTAAKANVLYNQGTGIGSSPNALEYFFDLDNTVQFPAGGWWYGIRMGHGDPDTYYSGTLAMDFGGSRLAFRGKTNGSDNAWREVWHSGNFDPATKANASHTHSYLPLGGGSVTGFTTFSGAGWFKANETGDNAAILHLGSTTSGNVLYSLYTDDATADSIRLHTIRWAHDFNWTRNSSGGVSRNVGRLHGSANWGGIFDLYGDESDNTVKVRLNAKGDSYFLGGNLGLGMTAPTSKLQVGGDFSVTGGGAKLRLVTTTSTTYIQSALDFTGGSAAPLVFGTMFASSEWARFSAGGDFGIGTTNPTDKLHVANGGVMVEKAAFNVLHLKRTNSAHNITMCFQGNDGGATYLGRANGELRVGDAGDLANLGKTVWHSGNFDPASKAAASHTHSEYAAASHTHSDYLSKSSGGTVAGDLVLNGNVAIGLIGDLHAKIVDLENRIAALEMSSGGGGFPS